MNANFIKRINDVDIVTVGSSNIVPIKPLCEALGVDPEAQRQKIKDPFAAKEKGLKASQTRRSNKNKIIEV